VELTKSQKYTVFEEDVTRYVYVTMQEFVGTAAATAIDTSASTTKVYFRAMTHTTPTSVLTPVELTNVGDGTDGIVAGNVRFVLPYQQIECRIVLVDELVADAQTITTYKERVWKRWLARVDPSPAS